jgi:signal transduction histidine kinase/DNA-binding response OmpR family regulator/predicted RNA-binding protein with RPS1 domain
VSIKADHAYIVGQRVVGKVEQILPFGIFVRLEDGTRAYIRRRELSWARDVEPSKLVSLGQELAAVVIDPGGVDRSVELSHKVTLPDPWGEFTRRFQERSVVTATVKNLIPSGAFVQIVPGVDGFIPLAELAPWTVEGPEEVVWVGDDVEAVITRLDPTRRKVWLSIRQRLEQLSLVDSFMERLRQKAKAEGQAEPSPEEVESTPEERSLAGEELQPCKMAQLGQILVVDDHDEVRLPLVEWLCRQGCPAEGAKTAVEAIKKFQQQPYGLVLVDLVLPEVDGLALIRQLRANRYTPSVAVMSIPEWIRERFGEIQKLGVVGVFVKPLDLEEVQWFLIRLARGETLMPLGESPIAVATSSEHRPFQKLGGVMRSGQLLAERLRSGLEHLLELTQAEVAIVFHLNPISQEVSIVAQAGQAVLNLAAIYSLVDSPVKDVIREGGLVWENHVSGRVGGRFSKLLNLLPFESCIGVPIQAGGEIHHALFLFHHKPKAFSRYRVRDAQAMATLFSVALESQALEQHIRAVSPFLLSGHLAAGFSHEVYNKMSGLEIQLRNLRTDYERLGGQEALQPVESSDFAEVGRAVNRLLDVALDLKRTVGLFQELIRAEPEEEVAVNEVVRHAELLLRPIARRHKVRVEMELTSDLPAITGSVVRLQQVFSNVMLNAVQHTARKMEWLPNGRGTLQVMTAWEPEEDRPIRVRFTDNGSGIHRQLWENIFALGFSTRPGGTGLGLFIARSLVESMGGRILVEQSVIPMETTFLVELPAA